MHRIVEVILGGSGGQGMNLAGQMLAQAIAEEEGKNVIETELYGISMRGGISLAQVLFSEGEVTDVRVTEADIIIAMSGEFASLYVPKIKEGGIVLSDSHVKIPPLPRDAKVLSLPFIEEARRLGNEMVANVIALGALIGATRIVSKESLRTVLRSRFSGSALDLNLSALEIGEKIALDSLKNLTFAKKG
ncbi:MAG: 2-oxoacid:acceptor oxidoreductase family protein [Candidatus Methanomethyliaceae archaeon]